MKSETRYWAKSKNRAGQVRSLLPMYTKALSHPTRSYYMQFIPIYFPIQALFFFLNSDSLMKFNRNEKYGEETIWD